MTDGLPASRGGPAHEDIVYPATIPFVVLHLSCFAVIWTGISTSALLLCVALYLVRIFGVTGGYHRYFAHRSYRTSRGLQLLLALLAQSTTQRGVLWWSAVHRLHHAYSDTERDIHSRRQHGFWYAHMGWIFAPSSQKPDYSVVQDLARYPELVWLDRYPYLLPTTLAAVPCFLIAGWSGLFVGFAWSTTLIYHVTFAINSVAHGPGRRRYVTGDDSRNSFWLALLALGEGWHNNHHAYPNSARQGFRRGEIDVTYRILQVLALMHIVWDLREPPPDLLRNARRPGIRAVGRAARLLAADVAGDLAAAGPERAPARQALRRRARELYPEVPQEHLGAVIEGAAAEIGEGPETDPDSRRSDMSLDGHERSRTAP
ncbi:MAG: acyl-CoA desaturase [Gemmatimonadota bacterium]